MRRILLANIFCDIIFAILVSKCLCLEQTKLFSEGEVHEYYPDAGDIPMLNRKIERGRRVEITEHPYVVSIRRQYVHYLTGTLLKKNTVVTVAHPLVNVPITELNIVAGENYCDRGARLNTVLFLFVHEKFNPQTLIGDIALLIYYDHVPQKTFVKPVKLGVLDETKRNAIVTGWGRCDVTGIEYCLPRSSIYFPDEIQDPMLQSVVIKYQNSTYCEVYARHGVSVKQGMRCVGTARREMPGEPCMAVPGAPLVVDGMLAGIQSWGYGCGYPTDLPIIYTDIDYYNMWIQMCKAVIAAIPPDELTYMFNVTRAVILYEWLYRTRTIKAKHFHDGKELKVWPIDKYLRHVDGTVYDVRDFFENGKYRPLKLFTYRELEEDKDVNDLLPPVNSTTEIDIVYKDQDYPENYGGGGYDVGGGDGGGGGGYLTDTDNGTDVGDDVVYPDPVNRSYYDQLILNETHEIK